MKQPFIVQSCEDGFMLIKNPAVEEHEYTRVLEEWNARTIVFNSDIYRRVRRLEFTVKIMIGIMILNLVMEVLYG